jgi:hypothetical protein
MTVKSVFVHKTEKSEVLVINPDVVYTVTKDNQRMIKYYTTSTAVTVYQKRNSDGEYTDEEIYIDII